MKIQDITSHQSADDMVEALKRRATKSPDISKLRKEYYPSGHRIFDTAERPDKAVKGQDGTLGAF